jgi:hypothetical protein
MSAQCPQTVPRKPANVGEGQRNLDVSLTWLFVLTEALIGVDCEVVCEADTELITQRSEVQILPPLLVKSQVRGAFAGQSTLASDVECRQGVG